MSQAALKTSLINYSIAITAGNSKGLAFEFNKGVVSAGRGSDNDIILGDDPKISRKHFEIKQTDAGLFIELLSPKNYMLLNGKKVSSGLLKSGNIVTIGDTDLLISFLDLGSESIAPVQKVFSEPINQRFDVQIKNNTPSNFQIPPTPSPALKPRAPSMPPPPPPSTYRKPRARQVAQGNSSLSPKAQFYLLIGIVLIGFYFYSQEGPVKAKTAVEIRTTEQIQNDLLRSQQTVDTLKRQRSQNNQESKQYENAQQYYVKGFRDYKQGQYSRANQSFQAALSFYPQHQLARKYLDLSRKKQDEFVQYNMLQGRRYRERGNYRLCQASFQHVLIAVMDPNNKTYNEAKQFFDECANLGGERY